MKGWVWVLACLPSMATPFGGLEKVDVFSADRIVSSSHFRLHHEEIFAPPVVLNTLESLHAKLLLDLGAFSPWAYQEKIHVYLYKNAESYAAHTGMPPWAVAHINVTLRTIYGYPSPELQRVLAHELGHLFFTQFFLAKSTAPPLWLNEGVATMMEWNYGLEGEQDRRDTHLRRFGAPPLDTFFKTTYQHAGDADGEAVGLWYAQAESLTRYLMRGFSRAQFLAFCEKLREGKSLDDSLRAAFGMAIPDAATLEKLWRAHAGLS